MVSRRVTGVITALAILGTVVAGCSGDDPSADTTGVDQLQADLGIDDSTLTGSPANPATLDLGDLSSGAQGDRSSGSQGDGPGGPGHLEDVDLSALDLRALGELLAGKSLEQRIEASADVDVAFTDHGFTVDSRSAALTVDDDGRFTITFVAEGDEQTAPDEITGNLGLGG